MGFYTAAGAAVNAAPQQGFVQSAVDFSGSGGLTPAATRVVRAAAPIVGAAVIACTAFATLPLEASVSGHGNVYLNPTKTHTVEVGISAHADVRTFVTRTISESIQFTGLAALSAIPSSKIGASDVIASASIGATATRIAPARAISTSAATATATATHFRLPEADIQASGDLYVEVGINGVFEANCVLPGTAAVVADPLNLKSVAQAEIIGTASGEGEAIRTQSAKAASMSAAFVVTSAPTVVTIPLTFIDATVSLTADATRVLVSEAQSVSRAEFNIVGGVSQTHSSHSAPIGAGYLAADETLTTYADADIFGGCSVVADVTTFRMSIGSVDVAAELAAEGVRVSLGAADVTCSASTGIDDAGLSIRSIYVNAEVAIQVEATVVADSFANIDSQDPDCRIFYRLPEQTEFVRPAEDFEFIRRCA
jgi:hypothetical protein